MHPVPLQHPRAHTPQVIPHQNARVQLHFFLAEQHSNTLFPFFLFFPPKIKSDFHAMEVVFWWSTGTEISTHTKQYHHLPSSRDLPQSRSLIFMWGAPACSFLPFNRPHVLLCQGGTNDQQLHSETGARSEYVYLTHFPPKSGVTVTCSHEMATTKYILLI